MVRPFLKISVMLAVSSSAHFLTDLGTTLADLRHAAAAAALNPGTDRAASRGLDQLRESKGALIDLEE